MEIENNCGEHEILIVEDSQTQAEQLKSLLQKNNYKVCVACNGREAIDLMNKNIPTIVISDIVMPEMDGYHLCKYIKSDDALKKIPVVLLTSLSDPGDVLKGLECGADNFITKPYDEKILVSRLKYLIINKQLRENDKVQMGVEIFFGGQKYFITAERQQILDLLFSTYETAVWKNIELIKVQEELKALNEQLEEKVEERTRQIENSLKEKEVLLREIHHRVKNNMQIISSLLRLQSGYITEKKYKDMNMESQNRIFTMSLIHEKLCQSADLAKIEVGGYFKELVNGLFISYDINQGKITKKFDIENVSMGMNSAIPCGLIINELITNSLKHAFPGGKSGEVKISLRSIGNGYFELIIEDNGIGLPTGMDFKKIESLGIRMVTILVENQLHGEISFNTDRGTQFHIKFKEVK